MDNKAQEKDRKRRLKDNMILIAFGIVLFVVLMNFEKAQNFAGTVIGFMMPLIIGGIIAFVLNVPMHFFEKKLDRLTEKKDIRFLKKGRTGICLAVTMIIFIAVILFIGRVVGPNAYESVKSIALVIQDAYPAWIDYFKGLGIDMSFIENTLEKIDFGKIFDNIMTYSEAIISSASHVFGAAVNFGLGFIFAIYILLAKKKLGMQMKKIAYAYLKKEWADKICDVASLSYRTFSVFLSGQCLEACILGAMFFAAMLITGFPYPGTIAIVIGALSLIPYIGAFIGMAFGLLLIAAVSIKQAFWFIILFLVVQQIEGNIIYPKVVGGSVGLPALWTLLAVIVGGKIAGIIGMIFFIPLFSVLYTLIGRSVKKRLHDKELKI